MNKLKECPFCGGIAKLKECLGDHWVACSICGASVGLDLNKNDCISFWNKRHLTPATPDSEGRSESKILDEDLQNCDLPDYGY